jgi:hypothetical protein
MEHRPKPIAPPDLSRVLTSFLSKLVLLETKALLQRQF